MFSALTVLTSETRILYFDHSTRSSIRSTRKLDAKIPLLQLPRFRPLQQNQRALSQRLLLLDRSPSRTSPSNLRIRIDEEDISDVLILHPHRCTKIF